MLAEQRADRPPLRTAPLSGVHSLQVHPGRLGSEDISIRSSTRPSAILVCDLRHQSVVGDRVEVALQIRVHHVRCSRLFSSSHRRVEERILAAASGTKAVAMLGEVPLERSVPGRCASAVCTTRSRTVGIPSGRCSSRPGLGIHIPPDRLTDGTRAVSQFRFDSVPGS